MHARMETGLFWDWTDPRALCGCGNFAVGEKKTLYRGTSLIRNHPPTRTTIGPWALGTSLL